MATITWIEVIAICVTPALTLFLCAGALAVYKHAKAWIFTRSEEVDHEL